MLPDDRITVWEVFIFGVFLVRIFPHLDWIRKGMEYLSIFSPNVVNYRPGNIQIRALSTQWFSISCYNVLTSLILITWKIPLEYRLIASLPITFPVFFTFFSLFTLLVFGIYFTDGFAADFTNLFYRQVVFLYLLHPLNILAFYAAQCPFLFYQQYLQRIHYYYFNKFPAFDIIFITSWNHHHMTNNMIDKGNVNASNDTCIITF